MQQQIADEESNCLEVVYEDLESFFRKEEEKQMVGLFRSNVRRYMEFFGELAEEFMPKREKPVNPEDVRELPFRNCG
ncbi:unnamed protein product [Sphagnum balticum]